MQKCNKHIDYSNTKSGLSNRFSRISAGHSDRLLYGFCKQKLFVSLRMHYVYVMSVFDKDIQIIIKYPHTLVIIILLCQNFYLALMYMQLYAFTLLLIPPFLNWLNLNIISVHFRNIFVLKDIRVFTSVM